MRNEREEKPEDYIELAREVIKYRDYNGFSPAHEHNFCAKLMGINAEVVELERELRKPNNFQSVRMETADVANYALATTYDLRGTVTVRHTPVRLSELRGPAEMCAPIRGYTAQAFEKWRRYNMKDAAMAVELVILECQRLAATFDFSLPLAVREKLAINYARPHRHGGKHPDS